MQTFLPYPNFIQTAQCLDMRRLGKQRIETKTILNILLNYNDAFIKKVGWRNHPAVIMWKGYEYCLALYGFEICNEWISRGYKDTTQKYFSNILYNLEINNKKFPYWFGDNKFHSSHKAALLYKDFNYYSKFCWDEKPELNYKWPAADERGKTNT